MDKTHVGTGITSASCIAETFVNSTQYALSVLIEASKIIALAYNYISSYVVQMTELETVARSLAALGHAARLDIFRVLIRAGHAGMTVGQIATHLDMAASTLAHHLRSLVEAGLVIQNKNGRETVNTAHFDEMTHLVSFLTDECCTGVNSPQSATATILTPHSQSSDTHYG